jgi:uncharacterized membrane protein (UPF0127 family)
LASWVQGKKGMLSMLSFHLSNIALWPNTLIESYCIRKCGVFMAITKTLKISEGTTLSYRVAASFFTRFLGLMGRKPSDYGLLLIPCNSVHTCFMRYDLDVFFLDRDYKVLAIRRDMKPWRVTSIIREARMVLELPSSLNALKHIEEGTRLIVEP